MRNVGSDITVLVEEPNPGEGHSSVCFLVWNWLEHPLTIIPDGFGTHGGTGGWGLAVALELINFCKIPLNEHWIPPDQFERFASGFPRKKDIELIEKHPYGVPSWPAYRREFHGLEWREALHGAPVPFPYGLVLPELMVDLDGFDDDPESAIWKVMRRFETALRTMGGYGADLIGENLVNQATGDSGTLQPKGDVENEIKNWKGLFRGLIGAIRNPHGHRVVETDRSVAVEQILMVDLLLRKLKDDYPDRYKVWQGSLRPEKKAWWEDEDDGEDEPPEPPKRDRSE